MVNGGAVRNATMAHPVQNHVHGSVSICISILQSPCRALQSIRQTIQPSDSNAILEGLNIDVFADHFKSLRTVADFDLLDIADFRPALRVTDDLYVNPGNETLTPDQWPLMNGQKCACLGIVQIADIGCGFL